MLRTLKLETLIGHHLPYPVMQITEAMINYVCLFVCLYVPIKLVLHNVESYGTVRQIGKIWAYNLISSNTTRDRELFTYVQSLPADHVTFLTGTALSAEPEP
jgi:hypothetical protein